VGSTPAGRASFSGFPDAGPFVNEPLSLGALFLSSFTSATVLPGTSEVALAAVLAAGAAGLWAALGVATLGNTLGGMSSYLIGRVLPKRLDSRALSWMSRYGALSLLFSWVLLVGDALCVAAGWLRINPWLSVLCIALGKFARYWVIAQLVM
jgi:membrane protein YqaA with SNARE-associated domain